jgi:hypothetical protein
VKITDWNPTGIRIKGRPKNRDGENKVINDLKKVKLRRWIWLVTGGNDLVQRTKTHVGL